MLIFYYTLLLIKLLQDLTEAENVVETELENDQLSEMFIKIKELKKQGYPIRNSYYFMGLHY